MERIFALKSSKIKSQCVKAEEKRRERMEWE